MILKLDLKKAFDYVDKEFLEEVMKLKAFDAKWISWIQGRFRNPKFSIFINGRSFGRIMASQGLREGDPLFSFLFLSSEVLSALIDIA